MSAQLSLVNVVIFHMLIQIQRRDSTAARTLTTTMATPGGGANLTVALCTSACQAAGYILAGVEYAGECCGFPPSSY